MISSGYKPDGVDATYAEIHGYDKDPGEKYFANPYAYALYVVKPGEGESCTNFFAYANSMEWVNYLKCNQMPGQYPFLMMRAIPETKDGFVFYNLNKDMDQKDTSYTAYLITYPGKMPYRSVSRKEYLEFCRGECIKEKQRIINDPSITFRFPVRRQKNSWPQSKRPSMILRRANGEAARRPGSTGILLNTKPMNNSGRKVFQSLLVTFS
jgi:hypothetical protein